MSWARPTSSAGESARCAECGSREVLAVGSRWVVEAGADGARVEPRVISRSCTRARVLEDSRQRAADWTALVAAGGERGPAAGRLAAESAGAIARGIRERLTAFRVTPDGLVAAFLARYGA